MSPDEFREAGHRLVDRLADFLRALPARRITPGRTPGQIRSRLGGGPLPDEGAAAGRLLDEAADLLLENSVLNGHPRFLGYIVGSPMPLGALADLLASTLNQNLGAWHLSPMATEIESQAVRWIAELIGFPPDAGGLLGSGGNMANFVAFLAARRRKAPWDAGQEGTAPAGAPRLCLYATAETHTWVHKAAELSGLGREAIRWVATDSALRMDMADLERRIAADRAAGRLPFLAIATAGSVTTGAVDDLPRLSEICRREGLWMHVDGAYGGFASGVPGAPPELAGLALADSIAVDPHKWLYVPIEAGCTLVRDRAALPATFEHAPSYYPKPDPERDHVDYHSLGLQNSRGFRALKVWLALRLAGRQGYRRMIGEDIALARELHGACARHPELEAVTLGLSIVTFRFVPADLGTAHPPDQEYLDRLNGELIERLQDAGDVFPSKAVIGGRTLLRACIVNFRTTAADVAAVPEIVVREGRALDRMLRAGAR